MVGARYLASLAQALEAVVRGGDSAMEAPVLALISVQGRATFDALQVAVSPTPLIGVVPS
jgi:hypothetical protein